MAKIRDGRIKEVLEKLRLLSYEIEEINRMFDTVDRTGNTLDDFRVRVDYYANEMADLRRQVERGSAPLPSQNQQAGTDRFPILMYSGECNSLSRFLKHFYTWALSSQSEDALSYSCPVIMTGDKSRRELERKYGRRIRQFRTGVFYFQGPFFFPPRVRRRFSEYSRNATAKRGNILGKPYSSTKIRQTSP